MSTKIAFKSLSFLNQITFISELSFLFLEQ